VIDGSNRISTWAAWGRKGVVERGVRGLDSPFLDGGEDEEGVVKWRWEKFLPEGLEKIFEERNDTP
jgi:hypothetical protein